MSWTFQTIVHPKYGGELDACILMKRTYAIDNDRVVAKDAPPELVESDLYDGDNFLGGEVLAESDLVACKEHTDVVVTGSVHAPGGRTAYHVDCGVRVGPLSKTLRAWGDRDATIGTFGSVSIADPQPFTSMPLGYCRAYGGKARGGSGETHSYARNPIGTGYLVRGGVRRGDRIAMPNFEDPAEPVTAETLGPYKPGEWQLAPKPVSLGWTRRDFHPRYTYAGVLPAHLEAARESAAAVGKTATHDLTVPPMDPRFYQGASEGLWGGPLAGDEPVSLRHLDPVLPHQQFALPGDRPRVDVSLAGTRLEPPVTLQTVVIDKNTDTLSLVWRAAVALEYIEQFAMLTVWVESDGGHSGSVEEAFALAGGR
ncbi:MAG: DUF2169 domain-containing protein [Chitinivibrionales bacterium]|nr:DUF2169 domain-containing protein [Chitinivibrionales bacterium]